MNEEELCGNFTGSVSFSLFPECRTHTHAHRHAHTETKWGIIEGGNTHMVYFYAPTSVSDFHAKALTFSSSLASLVHTVDQVQAVISGHTGLSALLRLACVHINCQLMPPLLQRCSCFFSLCLSPSQFLGFLGFSGVYLRLSSCYCLPVSLSTSVVGR